MSEDRRFKGLEIELHRFRGARVLRVVHPGEQTIEEHRHDWAYIGLHIAGQYREHYDGGEAEMAGPCAVLHPVGRPHADVVGTAGLETLTIEFDVAWLRLAGFNLNADRSMAWVGGRVGLAARQLADRLAGRDADETAIRNATADFLDLALAADSPPKPPWLGRARRILNEEQMVTAATLARRLDLHPAYVAQTYRGATGEGIGETQRRRRVERAATMLRQTGLPLAEIALAAGFCDQSHMNRCFAAVLGRTPLRVRHERRLFEERAAGAAH